MKFLKKLFLLPTPVELGKSEHDALPSSLFPNDEEDEYTWEDYDREMQTDHPVLWFLNRTIPRLWRRYIWGTYAPLERARYWLVSHLIPSRRYHLLDLRQDGPGEYKYGWIDSDRQLLYACFKILKNYVENELPNSYVQQEFTEEELANEPGAAQWYTHYQEVKALHHYWTVERPAWQKIIDKLSGQAYDHRQNRKIAESNRVYALLHREQDRFDQAETDALIRLIKTRKGMWT